MSKKPNEEAAREGILARLSGVPEAREKGTMSKTRTLDESRQSLRRISDVVTRTQSVKSRRFFIVRKKGSHHFTVRTDKDAIGAVELVDADGHAALLARLP
jgi:hypothetical protein